MVVFVYNMRSVCLQPWSSCNWVMSWVNKGSADWSTRCKHTVVWSGFPLKPQGLHSSASISVLGAYMQVLFPPSYHHGSFPFSVLRSNLVPGLGCTAASHKVQLTILAMHELKTAKIINFCMFCPVILLILHVSKIYMTLVDRLSIDAKSASDT